MSIPALTERIVSSTSPVPLQVLHFSAYFVRLKLYISRTSARVTRCTESTSSIIMALIAFSGPVSHFTCSCNSWRILVNELSMPFMIVSVLFNFIYSISTSLISVKFSKSPVFSMFAQIFSLDSLAMSQHPIPVAWKLATLVVDY